MNFAFVFPGQGSQSVGMMTAYGESAVIRETFAEASAALGEDLWEMVADGPAERLALTVNTQPLMLTAGVAVYREWIARGGATPSLVAGHSLGEYSALVAAGAVEILGHGFHDLLASWVDLDGVGVDGGERGRALDLVNVSDDAAQRIGAVGGGEQLVDEVLPAAQEGGEVGGAAGLAEGEQDQAGEGGGGPLAQGELAVGAEVVEHEAEVRGEGRGLGRRIDEGLEAGGGAPAGVAVVEDDGDDDRELGGGVGEAPVPDAQHVVEQAQGHPRVVAALVLEQDVDAGGASVEAEREQEIGVALAQAGVDEAAGLAGEDREVHAREQGRREDAAQRLGGALGLGEGGLEQRVVRGRGHGARR